MNLDTPFGRAIHRLQQQAGLRSDDLFLAEAVVAGMLFDLSPADVAEQLDLGQVSCTVRVGAPGDEKIALLRVGQVLMLAAHHQAGGRFELTNEAPPHAGALAAGAVTLALHIDPLDPVTGKRLSAWVQLPAPIPASAETAQAA